MRTLIAFVLLFIYPNVLYAKPKPGNIRKASLKGSLGSLIRQNAIAKRDGLIRINNDQELANFISTNQLVELPQNDNVHVDYHLKEESRYCLPWTRDFILNMARLYYQKFQWPIYINSAVRTVESQMALHRSNPNAAPAFGLTASSHLYGSTIDIAKKIMSPQERRWMRNYLLNLERQGLIEATEENYQAVFHVMIFKP